MEKISIGNLLKNRRTELRLTQREIANQVGVTEATVSRWESGDIDNMRRDKIAGLANALKVSPLLIMGIDNPEIFYKPVNNDESELLDDYRGIDAEDKNIVRDILRRFKSWNHLRKEKHNDTSNNFNNSGDVKNNFVAYGGQNSVNQNVTMGGAT